VRVDHDVPDLCGEVRRPAKQAAAGDDAASDARTKGDEEDVVPPDAGAIAALAYGRAGCVIIDMHACPVAKSALEPLSNLGAVRSEQVRGEPEQPLEVDEAGNSDADADRCGVAFFTWRQRTHAGPDRAEEVLAQQGKILDDRLTVVAGVTTLLHEDVSALVEDDAEDLGPPDVDADSGGRRQPLDSTRAFRSRMAAWRMLPSARRLMNPGSGTRSSTISL